MVKLQAYQKEVICVFICQRDALYEKRYSNQRIKYSKVSLIMLNTFNYCHLVLKTASMVI